MTTTRQTTGSAKTAGPVTPVAAQQVAAQPVGAAGRGS